VLAHPPATPEAVARRLRAGEPLADDEFDGLYPGWARGLSTVHWTPVAVARRVAELLVVRPGMRVLDVGAGVGKLCLVAALTADAHFTGVEQRWRFVEAAQAVATRLGVGNASFLHRNMTTLDWSQYDAFYLYNPFAENLGAVQSPIDSSVDLDVSYFQEYVRFVRAQLRAAAPGARVVTYHGFGGDLPAGWGLEHVEHCHTDRLEVWVQGRATAGSRRSRPGSSAHPS